jgi:KaiC/GvpD/RAD55 family RecA-like ATPase
MTAGWITTGGRVEYATCAQSPDEVRTQLRRLRLEPDQLEREEKLTITDWYTATLGQKSKEKSHVETLKVSELSIGFSKDMKGPPGSGLLIISDDESFLARFNEEKAWIEFELTRVLPLMKSLKAVCFLGVMVGVHSDWAYRRLEGGSDGIVDFRLDEKGDPPGNHVRLRSKRNVGFDGHWHPLRLGENFEVTIEK